MDKLYDYYFRAFDAEGDRKPSGSYRVCAHNLTEAWAVLRGSLDFKTHARVEADRHLRPAAFTYPRLVWALPSPRVLRAA